MGKDEIVTLVNNYISQSIQGLEVENPKFDFKKKWYDLSTVNGIGEFVKDTSAIANTFGPDGFLVIGYDEKTKCFENATFSDCGLRDTSALLDIINRHVDRQFTLNYYEETVNGHNLGILHIPPSTDKPHVIRSYKTEKNNNIREEAHKIFIRKNTQTYPATKYDLELMYYDRKNILPEYEIVSSFHKDSFRLNSFNPADKSVVPVIVTVNLENTGRRPVSICEISFAFCVFHDPSYEDKIIRFKDTSELKSDPIIVSPGTITGRSVSLISNKMYNYEMGCEMFSDIHFNIHRLGIREMKLILTNGQVIASNLTIIK